MYGWRGKIGIIIPSANTTMEPELWKMAPEGVSIHCSRMFAMGCSTEDLKRQDEDVERCAGLLGSADMDVVIYGCTSGSFVNGPEWERALQKQIAEEAHCKSITTTGAVLDALRIFGKKNLTVVNPYNDEVSAIEHEFFARQGFCMTGGAHLGYDQGADIRSQTPERAFRLAKGAVRENTEILFISCTNFRTIEVLEDLEKDLGIPVISSNQASLWAALKSMDVKAEIKGYGALFAY